MGKENLKKWYKTGLTGIALNGGIMFEVFSKSYKKVLLLIC